MPKAEGWGWWIIKAFLGSNSIDFLAASMLPIIMNYYIIFWAVNLEDTV